MEGRTASVDYKITDLRRPNTFVRELRKNLLALNMGDDETIKRNERFEICTFLFEHALMR